MRRLKKQLHLAIKTAKAKVSGPPFAPKYIHPNVPYFSQWESRELAEPIIMNQIDIRDDPLWRNSGASSKDEYAEWSWNGCGMACLKMVLAATHHKVIPLVTLGKKAAACGVYSLPLHESPGMFYKPFVSFIGKEFSLPAQAHSALTISEIKQAVSRGGYAIASVTPEIRFPNKQPTKKGGHLVLIQGYDDDTHTIFLHNPSGFKGAQENVELSESVFSRFFDNKGIVIFPNKH